MKTYVEGLSASDRLAWLSIIITLGVIGIYLILQGPYIHVDTPSYKQMDPRRSAGYPLFLHFFRIFGDGYLYIVITVQVLLSISAVVAFLLFIGRLFQLHPFSFLFVLPIIVYAALNNPFPREIMTEALAFPIFLFVVIFFFKGILNSSYQNMSIAMLLSILLVLVRSQFLYFFPVFFLGMLHIYLTDRNLLNLARYAALFSQFQQDFT